MDEYSNRSESERRLASELPVFCKGSGIDWEAAKTKLNKRIRRSNELPLTDSDKKQVQIISFFKAKEPTEYKDSQKDDGNFFKSTINFSQEDSTRESSNSCTYSSHTEESLNHSINFRPFNSKPIIANKHQAFRCKNQQRYSWLEDIRDSSGRTTDDPNYDPSTLYIPKNAWDLFSPFEKQFWEIKSKHMDTVMFFKKGKFFELYENDADLGSKHFNLKLTERVNMRMVGVPESSFEHWAIRVLKLGFNVAKVTQTESTVKKAMRQREEVKKHGLLSLKSVEDKPVNRELEYILTPGTLCDPALIGSDESSYCLSIIEYSNTRSNIPSFAICILEASITEFSLLHLEEDKNYVNILTVLAQTRPKEIILVKNSISRQVLLAIKSVSKDVIIIQRNVSEQLLRYDNIMDEVKNGGYFTHVPEVLTEASKDEICAFGSLLDYLKYIKIAKHIVPNGEYKRYESTSSATTMFLDAKSIINLELFTNSDNTTEGTLNKALNKCCTPFGKRLFERSLSRPLVRSAEIEARLEACDEIHDNLELFNVAQNCLSKLPDLERLAASTYSMKISLQLFVALLEGLQIAVTNLSRFSSKVSSRLLTELLCNFSSSDDFNQKVLDIRSCFNEKRALEDGVVEFKSGHHKELDDANETIRKFDIELENYRVTQSKRLGCCVKYRNIGKEWFQMEIPKNLKAPLGWRIKSDSALVSRYWDSKIESINLAYKEALEIRDDAIASAERKLYAMFSNNSKYWNLVIKKLASIDFLVCLAKNKKDLPNPKCRPILLDAVSSFIHLENARGLITSQDTCVLNDVQLGNGSPNLMLLTGPNMGGKSTLLRMVCNISIMAQIGCYVPATKCILTPFDKIFTRIGASDDIVAGKSTFMVELSETSNILNNASDRSLVILDEFGRGTSTFDGCSIAFATLYDLLVHKCCIGLFSTHYHIVANSYKDSSLISFKYMDFIIEEENSIIFLYKLKDGVCPKSYGMNVAIMADLPKKIIESALSISTQLELNEKNRIRTKLSFPSKLLCTLSSLRSTLLDTSSIKSLSDKKLLSLMKIIRLYHELPDQLKIPQIS